MSHKRRAMKAVILAGGLGTRMREETEFKPKPMVDIGGKPILWHIMKSFAAQGVSEFIICAGYKGDLIRQYFLNFDAVNRDFSIMLGSRETLGFHGELPEAKWHVTVAETGASTLTGGRLAKIQKFLNPEESFFITYGDGLANVNLSEVMSRHKALDAKLTISTHTPQSRFGRVETNDEGLVTSFLEKPPGNDIVNIGFMVANHSIFDYIQGDEPFETGALPRIAQDRKLAACHHEGFWQPMDTIREAESLNDLWNRGEAPWKTW